MCATYHYIAKIVAEEDGNNLSLSLLSMLYVLKVSGQANQKEN